MLATAQRGPAEDGTAAAVVGQLCFCALLSASPAFTDSVPLRESRLAEAVAAGGRGTQPLRQQCCQGMGVHERHEKGDVQNYPMLQTPEWGPRQPFATPCIPGIPKNLCKVMQSPSQGPHRPGRFHK